MVSVRLVGLGPTNRTEVGVNALLGKELEHFFVDVLGSVA